MPFVKKGFISTILDQLDPTFFLFVPGYELEHLVINPSVSLSVNPNIRLADIMGEICRLWVVWCVSDLHIIVFIVT